MDNQIKTSFIPRKPLTDGSNLNSPISSMSHKKAVGRTLFSLISTLIFLVSLAALGGTYLWQKQLNVTITQQHADMNKALDSFDEKFVRDATRLDVRIQESEKILKNHVSPSTLYALLSEYTRETVSFSQFSLADLKDGGIKLTANGEAVRYESIVLQSDSFGQSGFVRNVLFTNLSQDADTRRIGFTFEGQLDPRLILYKDRETILTSPNTQ